MSASSPACPSPTPPAATNVFAARRFNPSTSIKSAPTATASKSNSPTKSGARACALEKCQSSSPTASRAAPKCRARSSSKPSRWSGVSWPGTVCAAVLARSPTREINTDQHQRRAEREQNLDHAFESRERRQIRPLQEEIQRNRVRDRQNRRERNNAVALARNEIIDQHIVNRHWDHRPHEP